MQSIPTQDDKGLIQAISNFYKEHLLTVNCSYDENIEMSPGMGHFYGPTPTSFWFIFGLFNEIIQLYKQQDSN